MRPKEDWGPARKEDRIQWAHEILRKVTTATGTTMFQYFLKVYFLKII